MVRCDMLITRAIEYLRSANLAADESTLEPGGIVGGLSSKPTPAGTVFLHSFVISPEQDGFLASVSGPGNRSSEWSSPTLMEAAHRVVKEYADRGKLAQ